MSVVETIEIDSAIESAEDVAHLVLHPKNRVRRLVVEEGERSTKLTPVLKGKFRRSKGEFVRI